MVAVYVRQSIDKKDSVSIENQIAKCMIEVEENDDFKVYKDKGFSGKNINRPAFTELMKDVKCGNISKIVVYRLDRFSRSIADFGAVWKILSKFNVEFVSINEKFDTGSPIGVAMLNIIMVFAQLERETIAERVKDNYYMRAKTGSWVGGPAPYGFEIIKVNLDNRKVSKLTTNNNIEIVKRIFKEYSSENISLGEISKKLTKEGIPCAGRKSWDNVTVSRILHNPIYAKCTLEVYLYLEKKGVVIENNIEEFDGTKAGMIIGKRNRNLSKYNDISSQHFSLALHNGIIDSEIWLKCQYKLDANSQIKNTGKGKHTWLSGLLKCGNCGYSLKIILSKGKRYLVCSGKTNYHICDKSYAVVDLTEIESEIENEIDRIFKDNTIEFKEVKAGSDIADYIDEIKETDKKIQRLLEALSEGSSVSMKYINKEIERLESHKQKIIEKNRKDDKFKNVKKVIYKLNFNELDFEEKKKTAKELIERIEIIENEVNIVWKV